MIEKDKKWYKRISEKTNKNRELVRFYEDGNELLFFPHPVRDKIWVEIENEKNILSRMGQNKKLTHHNLPIFGADGTFLIMINKKKLKNIN